MKGMLIWMALAASAAWPFSSCDPAELKHPLSEPAQAKLDARLPGVWAGRIGDTQATVHVVVVKDGLVDVVVIGATSSEGAAVLTYQGFTSTVGGKSYLNLRSKKYSDMYGNKFELSPNYTLVQYELGKDGALNVGYLGNGGSKKAMDAGLLHGAEGTTVVLSDESPALTAFLEKADPKTTFEPLASFKKVSVDYGKPLPKSK